MSERLPIEIIAELATAHGGDVDLACDMVAAAADSGAHTVKIQSYTLEKLNPRDPQADWLRQAHLDELAHERIRKACETHRVQCLSTAFDRESLLMLIRTSFGGGRIKVASSQLVWNVTRESYVYFVKSWAWGKKETHSDFVLEHLTAIPLYPTPIECVSAAPLLDGWSDHTIGTTACEHMISRGARIIEAHFCLPGRSRQMPWDKTPAQLREIRDWADCVATMTTGVSTQFRERWRA